MQIQTSDDGRVTVVSVEGDLVLGPPESTFKRTISELLERGRVNLLVDLGKVRYLDSSGLGALVRALSESQKEGGQTKLLNAGPRIRQILEITRLEPRFECYADLPTALKNMR